MKQKENGKASTNFHNTTYGNQVTKQKNCSDY